MRLSPRWFLALLTITLLTGAGWHTGHRYAAAATPTPPPSPAADLTIVSSPDGRWQALVNAATGSLTLQQPDGQTVSLFPPGSAVNAVEWSPDSQALVIVTAPLTLWRVQTSDPQAQPPQQVFAPPASFGPAQAGQIRFGPWSPNGRYLLFWWGPPGVSTLADGLAVAALDVNAGQVTPLAETALLTPGYQSWAPDSSAVALTAGPGREAQANKWLVIWAAGSGPATPIISQTAQIPGQVVWSPRGDVIAYAAISATLTVTGTEHVAGWDNPGNAGRRIYLLDPATGRTRRLNSTEAFQDAPRWSDDGRTLYYVERQGAKLHLLAADPLTGQAQPLAGGWQPLPEFVGYYGQGDFEALLARRRHRKHTRAG